MPNYKTLAFSNYDIFISDLRQIQIKSKMLVNTINPYSFLIAKRDLSFRKALLNSDILLPDGIGIVAALKLFYGKTVKRIAGSDLHEYLLKKLNEEGKRCFYLGSSENTLQIIKKRLRKEYPNIKPQFYSPPFVADFNEEQSMEMIQIINSFKPDVLFIGMTAPKQEKWGYLNKDRIEAKLICSIGAVFDFYAGTVIRSSKFWINLGLEWLPRLIQEPKRLWKRTFYYTPKFIYWSISEKAKQIINPFYYSQLKPHIGKDILIIGYNKITKKIIEYLERDRRDINVIGICEEPKNMHELTHYPIIAGIDNTLNVALTLKVEEIYSTISPDSDKRVAKIMEYADNECIRFKHFPDFYQFSYFPTKELNYLKDLPVMLVRNEPLEKFGNRVIKKASDFCVSLSILVFILSWLIPLLAVLISIESPGPIFFIQQRAGRNRRPFKCIKFRSMHINKDADMKQAIKNDPRFTKIGRLIRYTGMDELPQVINVLLGSMSLVGPRPHMLKHTEDFSKLVEQYPARHFVKPGITGWAQVKSYRGEITNAEQIKERLEHDMWYIENWSFLLDMRIIIMTIFRKIKGEKEAF